MPRAHHRPSPYACPMCSAALQCLVRSPSDHFCFACFVVVTVLDAHTCQVSRPPEDGWVPTPEVVPLDSLVARP